MKQNERLKNVRLKKNLTQKELSKLSGIAQNQISRYEKGQELSATSIIKICKALDITSDYLLGLVDVEILKKYK